MTFPRLAIHTGNTVDTTNKHSHWFGTVALQHNETTTTILKCGPNMKRAVRKRHPLLSTFQSNCEAPYWSDYIGQDFFGQEIVDGRVVPPLEAVAVLEQIRPFGQADQ